MPNMQAGSNFITDKREVVVNLVNGTTRLETWYLFRVPVSQFQSKVGNIPDFKSIRFIRMFMTGFEDTVVCRFAKLELIRNQWRRFTNELDTTGIFKTLPANDPVKVDVLAVNVEENDQREPIRYVEPPGIERQEQLSNNNVPLLMNEQSISLKLSNLSEHTTRGVFKTMNLDLRQYGKMSMFIHAEETLFQGFILDDELKGVIRIGNDFVGNYYEVRVPLKITPWGATDSLTIWPEANNLDFDLQELIKLKARRNKNGISPSQYYSEVINGKKISIIGNPNLGEVRGMLLGVENSKNEPITAEIWFNELRLSFLDEKGGWAAIGRLDITGADLFNLNISAGGRGMGFGTLEQKVNERSREDFYQLDIQGNIDAGKLLPRKANLQIPVFAGFSLNSATPEYDPYDLDIPLKTKLKAFPDKRDSIKRDAIDETTIKTIALTNVKVNKSGNKKAQPWDISNLDFNYSYTKTEKKNPLTDLDELNRTRGAIGYNFAPQPKFIEPFKKLVKSNSKWLSFVRDFNFNYKPSQFSFKADVFRQFGALQPRNVGGGPYKIPESYDKHFTFDRYYIVRWDLTRSISFDYSAINNARVDEPAGRIDTKGKKDSVRKNFFKGGRNTRFHQDATFTYNVPMNKIPALDWTSARASYKTDYDWIGASLLAKSLGNIITNGQTITVNGDLNFDQLYNKSRFLRAVYTEGPNTSQQNNNTVNPKGGGKKTVKKDSLSKKGAKKLSKLERKNERKLRRLQKRSQVPEVGNAERAVAKLLTSVKRVGIQYSETSGTSLPGYLDSTRFLGQNWKSMQPGFNFILGYQPDSNWINKKGEEGVLTHDPIFNTLIQQRFDQRFNLTAQITPLRDFNIDLNMDKTFNKNYTELFKDTTGLPAGEFSRLNPYALGSFSISYISFQTLFQKFDPNILSETFKQFEANRVLLSGKLGTKNPYNTNPLPGADGYYEGYGRYAQDVIIPSFIGAYTNKDPLGVPVIKNANPNIRSNPFSGLKAKPNWNINYTGLSRIKGLEKTFTSIVIRHGYRSTLSMNSYNSALYFEDPFRYGFPAFVDTLTGNYVPFFFVPNITIAEEFSPLFSMDLTFTNQLSVRFEYRKSRQLSLSLLDYQLAENRSTELTFGADWRVKGMPLIKKIGKMKRDNEVTFKIDFSHRDEATANSKLDQNTAFGTAGQKVIRINPTIDYIINSRIRAQLFFQQDRTIPKIATTAPVTNTRAGLNLRISLAQ
jgi:cell surface protein SprA